MTPPASSSGPLDELDASIFAALQLDGRRSYRSIARELGVPEATVRFRINRMLQEELVQITPVIHPRHLGGILATLLIRVALPQREAAGAAVEALRPVIYVSACSGSFDLIAQVVVPSLTELNQLIIKELAPIEGIQDVESLLETEVLKANYFFSALDLLD